MRRMPSAPSSVKTKSALSGAFLRAAARAGGARHNPCRGGACSSRISKSEEQPLSQSIGFDSSPCAGEPKIRPTVCTAKILRKRAIRESPLRYDGVGLQRRKIPPPAVRILTLPPLCKGRCRPMVDGGIVAAAKCCRKQKTTPVGVGALDDPSPGLRLPTTPVGEPNVRTKLAACANPVGAIHESPARTSAKAGDRWSPQRSDGVGLPCANYPQTRDAQTKPSPAGERWMRRGGVARSFSSPPKGGRRFCYAKPKNILPPYGGG